MIQRQNRVFVFAGLALCAMGLSACQTTGTPEGNLAATRGPQAQQAQISSLSAAPKQSSRPDLPMVIGVAY
jgi:hypothetical protein